MRSKGFLFVKKSTENRFVSQLKQNIIVMENLSLGLQLMVVGMLTVFAILLIVINGSKLLIAIVNQIAPEKAVAPKKQIATQQNAAILSTDTTIDAATMEILNQAVAQITQGKGRLANATKL